MKRIVRTLARAGLWAGMWACALVSAADFPDKPVRIIVPYSAGGTTDMVARLIGDQLSMLWKQPVVVDNRPGAGGIVGTSAAAMAAADGYSLLVGSVGEFAINPTLYKKLPYDATSDFAPVSLIARVPNVLVVSPKFAERARIQTVAELVAYTKANPKTVSMASTGVGTSTHLVGELFQRMTSVEMIHVPYKGSSPALADLMGGSVDLMFDNLPASLAYIRGGKLKALAVTTAVRSPVMPEVPTVAAAAALPDYDAGPWFGLLVPVKTPDSVIRKLNADLVRVLKEPVVVAKMRDVGAEPSPTTREEFAELMKRDRSKWGEIVKMSGATVD